MNIYECTILKRIIVISCSFLWKSKIILLLLLVTTSSTSPNLEPPLDPFHLSHAPLSSSPSIGLKPYLTNFKFTYKAAFSAAIGVWSWGWVFRGLILWGRTPLISSSLTAPTLVRKSSRVIAGASLALALTMLVETTSWVVATVTISFQTLSTVLGMNFRRSSMGCSLKRRGKEVIDDMLSFLRFLV